MSVPSGKKILVLMGNTETDSFSNSVANMYEESAKSAGHSVRRMNIGEMQFDPILHRGYKVIQALEPDLMNFQTEMRNADHFVVVYPNWWCSMPAILKGLFDRVWLPGFAFNFEKPSGKVIQRLSGKTARVIVLAGTHSPFMTWWKFGEYTNEISKGILGFAGMDVSVSTFGPCDKVEPHVHKEWLKDVAFLGMKGI